MMMLALRFSSSLLLSFFSSLSRVPVCCFILSCTVLKSAVMVFTTRPPAVPDVFDSGRNVGALRPARHVGFRSVAPGGQTTFSGAALYL